MSPEEFKELEEIEQRKEGFALDDLKDQDDRTLLYGFDVERRTFHVYIMNCLLHVLVYRPGYEGNKGKIHSHAVYGYKERVDPNTLIPNKRLYPERCDFETCALLREKGVYLPFTRYDGERAQSPTKVTWWGEIALPGADELF